MHRTKKIPVKNIARQLRAYAMMSAAIVASTPLVLRPLEAGPASEASPYSAPSLRVYCYLNVSYFTPFDRSLNYFTERGRIRLSA